MFIEKEIHEFIETARATVITLPTPPAFILQARLKLVEIMSQLLSDRLPKFRSKAHSLWAPEKYKNKQSDEVCELPLSKHERQRVVEINLFSRV
jgi:hypothetical protein